MNIAAFDLGSTYAVAWNWCGDLRYAVAHTDLNPNRTKPKLRLERPAVLHQFSRQFAPEFLRVADVIVYERPFARGQAATRLLWGMAGILEMLAAREGTAVLDITPSEIKKWAAGVGGAGKGDMIAAAHCLGYGGDNEHEADAYCLLKMAEATLTKEPA
jgi:Holliday junction resolvasome RuvABC endonuclease subunit